jgi:hypothetical protein
MVELRYFKLHVSMWVSLCRHAMNAMKSKADSELDAESFDEFPHAPTNVEAIVTTTSRALT